MNNQSAGKKWAAGAVFAGAVMVFMLIMLVVLPVAAADEPIEPLEPTENETQSAEDRNTIEITTHFFIPPLDLRGYDMNHFDVEQWFLERINYHREAFGLHPYSLYPAAVVTSIEHSLDMRDNNMGGNAASDGRSHQERHNRWFGYTRTMVTSAHSSSHNVRSGPLTQEGVNEIVERILSNEVTHSFLMNPTYYYIGFGFSIQANGRGRLSITMATRHGERAAHRARTPAEREAHRQQYLEMVRYQRGWYLPYPAPVTSQQD